MTRSKASGIRRWWIVAPDSLWRDRRFVRCWTGSAVSQAGDRVSELALPLTAAAVLDASAGQVAVLTAVVWAPHLLAIVLGAWVERASGGC
ncbi:hypothetical protein [Streptomyces sp. TRM68367]|uniref:hypothetical protein n=1 Tax=Streptomyces sp. TRM68367 TaxID=2758415 RepID=UPI0021CE30CD|nr:hypothetical protein [Streptomyces sp. TRM68367]